MAKTAKTTQRKKQPRGLDEMSPREIVAELDRYVVGQQAAKKAVAIALRNRVRRRQLDEEMAEEIAPKNIIMIGPTGVGKTEIARRLARMANSPFLKIEATKFTEIGYVGRDVESMVRDLVEIAVDMVREEKIIEIEEKAELNMEERVLDLLLAALPHIPGEGAATDGGKDLARIEALREKLRKQLRDGKLDKRIVELDVHEHPASPVSMQFFEGSSIEELQYSMRDFFAGMMEGKAKKRRMAVEDAADYIMQEEEQKLVDMEQVTRIAMDRVEESGIIFLDEIDKIATPGNVVGRDVSGGGVQRNLLKLMEETEVSLRTPFDLTSQLQAAMEFQSKGKVSRNVINTRHILFIVSGAFSGLAEIIRRRLGAKAIGFHAAGRAAPSDEDYFGLVRSSDFIEFGFESEFIGRLPVVVSCHELGEDDLFEILKNSEGSIMRQYVNAFDAYGIGLGTTDEGLRRIAQKAHEERTGARSLVGVCERTFREYKYNLPHSPVKELELTARLVDQPDAVLEEILGAARDGRLKEMDHELDLIAMNWSQANDIQIHLAPEAARTLSVRAFDDERALEEVFADIFKDFEHGLNLLRGAKGMEFVITEEVVRDPKAALDKWIRAYYANNK